MNVFLKFQNVVFKLILFFIFSVMNGLDEGNPEGLELLRKSLKKVQVHNQLFKLAIFSIFFLIQIVFKVTQENLPKQIIIIKLINGRKSFRKNLIIQFKYCWHFGSLIIKVRSGKVPQFEALLHKGKSRLRVKSVKVVCFKLKTVKER